jgi:predicted ATPase
VGDSGGVSELLWKGRSKEKTKTATIEAIASPPGVKRTILYRLSFTRVGAQLRIVDERIENEKPDEGYDRPYFYFDHGGGYPILY